MNNKQEIIAQIKKILKQRKHVFFKLYPNPSKQQLIMNAEKQLYYLESANEHNFKQICKSFAGYYIQPLIPAPSSKYHENIKCLYSNLINL
jgi:hypothetical protein